MKIAVFDLETQRNPADQGWTAYEAMGISSAALWISWQGGAHGRRFLFGPDRLRQLKRGLEAADVVVSWNGKGFDGPLLDHWVGEVRVSLHCDLMALLYHASGKRHKLADVAEATLGEGKDMSGALAPALWKAKRLCELHTYNMWDVEITRRLYEHVVKHGWLMAGGKQWTLEREI